VYSIESAIISDSAAGTKLLVYLVNKLQKSRRGAIASGLCRAIIKIESWWSVKYSSLVHANLFERLCIISHKKKSYNSRAWSLGFTPKTKKLSRKEILVIKSVKKLLFLKKGVIKKDQTVKSLTVKSKTSSQLRESFNQMLSFCKKVSIHKHS